MRAIDYHMHTCFSGDSEADPREHVKQAILMGLDEICFTDHRDFDYPIDSFDLDIEKYYQMIMALKEEFKDEIKIKWGIEIGLDMNHQKEINELIDRYPFDFVIGSIHVIDHTEFYYGDFFNGLSKEQAHRYFFEETLRCVKNFDCFNVLGHLDYIMRYGPYENKMIDHDKYQDLIDEIFKTLIAKNKGIEVNTSGYALLKTCGFPNFEQVKRYYDLGGRIITIGTDSHTSDRVGEHVEDVKINLEKIGFKDVTTFTNRKCD
ncbi:histidinol-phosphatase HisJ family protein [Thomasclavelia saccharogumia]|uniref:histidinol-phosphatase HisJ family protein n=1 Tax=Thomasclavelia saccharogumia TaxID=341225 RepID=UPI000479967D|nr:histidinol-phosphatase HisJ family protein [Thomasclavelia saccharogumia]